MSTMKLTRWPSMRPSVWKCPRASRGMSSAAAGGLRDRLRGALFRRGAGGSRRRRHLVRHLRHVGAEADQNGGKDHQVTHYATLDCRDRR